MRFPANGRGQVLKGGLLRIWSWRDGVSLSGASIFASAGDFGGAGADVVGLAERAGVHEGGVHALEEQVVGQPLDSA